MKRLRSAAPILLWYWLLVVGGLAVYTSVRIADASVTTPLWIGALTGTLIGQLLAVFDFKPWVAFAAIVSMPAWSALLPIDFSSKQLWMSYIAAALCGYWSLGDRGSLAAFWYPAMLWMLTILDHTSASGMPDRSGIALLGALAVAFLAFLRVRESRRIALWRTTGAAPVAPPASIDVLEEPPGRPVARGAWSIAVTAVAFGVTAWLAPKLWHTESFAGPTVTVVGDDDPATGMPCCPRHWEDTTTRSRVEEFLDLGRGHDALDDEPVLQGCRVCPQRVAAPDSYTAGGVWGDTAIVPGPYDVPVGYYDSAPRGYANDGTGVTAGGGGDGAAVDVATSDDSTSRGRSRDDRQGPATHSNNSATRDDRQGPAASAEYSMRHEAKDASPNVGRVQAVEAPAQPAPPPQQPEPAQIEQPAPPPPPPPQDDPPPAPQAAPPPPPPPAPVEAPPPAPAPTLPPKTDAPHAGDASPPAVSSTAPPPRAALDGAPTVLTWLELILGAALASQLLLLAMRPLRRAITLRHLRSPLWDETVDQRVSNAWQLALIGLRDAGLRTGHAEAPGELARRAKVEGLERCATILERARHGVGIDAGDLTNMTASADTAYHAARRRVGVVGRALGWLRWPLT